MRNRCCAFSFLINMLGGEVFLDAGAASISKYLASIFGFQELELNPKMIAWLIGGITELVTGIYYGIHHIT